jgi:hypothetical protein
MKRTDKFENRTGNMHLVSNAGKHMHLVSNAGKHMHLVSNAGKHMHLVLNAGKHMHPSLGVALQGSETICIQPLTQEPDISLK